MALVRINGYLHFVDCDSITVKKVSSGKWEVDVNDGARKFVVIGGVHSGGARNEWFLVYPEAYGEQAVPTHNMIKAIKMGVSV